MKKLSVLSFFALLALCLGLTVAAADISATDSAQLTLEQRVEVLDWMGLQTPEWLTAGSTSASYHPTCEAANSIRPWCGYVLEGCCCVQTRPGNCPRQCF